MFSFFRGIEYNIKGLILGLKTPRLFILGLLRFFIVLMLAMILAGLILYNHNEILNVIWQMPESGFVVYVWDIVSWLLSLVLSGIAVILAYLISQLLFCIFIMDYMSRITESIVSGHPVEFHPESQFKFVIYLIRQEIPRAILPIIITLIFLFMGLFTPISPVIFFISSIAASVFLAWDNTDLIPARRMIPFQTRLSFLKRNIFFHAGFGILFLIPWLNILFLSFAPIGATLYYLGNDPHSGK